MNKQKINKQEVLESRLLEIMGYVWELKNIKGRANKSEIDNLESKLLQVCNLVNDTRFNTYTKKTAYKI